MSNSSIGPHLPYICSVVHGKNEFNQDFASVYTLDRLRADIEGPLIEFAASVYRESIPRKETLLLINLIAKSVCDARALPQTGKDSSRLPSVVPYQMVTSSTPTTVSAPYNSAHQDDPGAEPQDDIETDPLDDDDDGTFSFTYHPLHNVEQTFDQHLQLVLSALPGRKATATVENEPVPTPPTGVPASAQDREEGQRTETPIAPARASWDNGEEVTADERNALLEMSSDAERARTMNIRRRDREQFCKGLIDSIPQIVSKIVPAVEKPKTKSKSKSKPRKKGEVESDATAQSKSDRSAQKKTSSSTSDTVSHGDTTHATLSSTLLPNLPVEENHQDSHLPGWMVAIMPHLQALSDDPQWTSLLRKWVELERQLGFPKSRVSILN